MSRRGYWTAAITHYGQERRAAHHVERQGFDFYLPEILNGRRRERLFPGYLFVRIREHWRCLLSTRGIRKLMLIDECPTRMPDSDVAKLMARHNDNGFIDLPPPFNVGDSVEITGGMFRDCLGLVQGMPATDRVKILVEILGRKVNVEMDKRLVRAA